MGPMFLCIFCFVNKDRFFFWFRPNSLNYFFNGNLFGRVALEGNFIILVLDNTYNSVSSAFVSYVNFDSEFVKWHARLGHVGQDRMSRLAREGFFYAYSLGLICLDVSYI